MYQSNDYVKLTRGYLKNLVFNEQALRNINADIETLNYELNSISLPGVKYSDEPRGGSPELSSVEQQAYVRDLKREELGRLEVSKAKLETHLRKMNASISQLGSEEQTMLDMFYKQKLSASSIGLEIGLCERSVHRRIHMAVRNLAAMLFGEVATEDISFVRS